MKNKGIFPNLLLRWRPDEKFCRWAAGGFLATLHSRCIVSHSLGLGTSLIRKAPLVRYLSTLTVEFLNMLRFFLSVGRLMVMAADEHWVFCKTKRGDAKM